MTSANGNRTTELLRKLLNERGVEWTKPSEKASVTHFNASGAVCIAYPSNYFDGGIRVQIDYRTPEQAIAATLGSEREKALEELVQDWQALYEEPDYGDCIRLRKRMQALGIEVIDE